jgi:caffeoyl-CoA O-methyltransferase
MAYLFPNQKKYSYLYSRKLKIEDQIYNFIFKIQDFKKKYNFKIYQDKKISLKEMGSNLVSIDLICFLIKIFRPNSILEIGSFIGRSSIAFSYSAPKKSKLYAIEKFSRIFKILKKNINANKLQKKIFPFEGDAKKILKSDYFSKKKFDFVFIDGNKENYLDYLKIIQNKTSKNCIIIIDDIFFHGDVFNKKKKTSKGAGVSKIYSYIKNNNAFDSLIIPISNGIMILKKK